MPREEQKQDAQTSQEVESGGKNGAARKKKQKKKKKHGAVQRQQERQNDANIGNEGSNNDTEMQDVEVSPQ
jgi:hypothetical protein